MMRSCSYANLGIADFPLHSLYVHLAVVVYSGSIALSICYSTESDHKIA